MHNWTDTQNEGWFRLALEETGVPYAYISDITVRNTPNLREKYDVILFPPTFFGLQQILNGIPTRTQADGSEAGGPIPWQNSSTTPNLGGVDEAADIRGGLGFDGVAHLKKFVEDGGLFIPIGPSAHLPDRTGNDRHGDHQRYAPAASARNDRSRDRRRQSQPHHLRLRRFRWRVLQSGAGVQRFRGRKIWQVFCRAKQEARARAAEAP